MKKIADVYSYLFEDFLILGFDKKWMNLFRKLPSFEVFLDRQNRLQLISKEPVESGAGVCE